MNFLKLGLSFGKTEMVYEVKEVKDTKMKIINSVNFLRSKVILQQNQTVLL